MRSGSSTAAHCGANERGELDLSPDMLRTLIVCQRMVDQAKET